MFYFLEELRYRFLLLYRAAAILKLYSKLSGSFLVKSREVFVIITAVKLIFKMLIEEIVELAAEK